MGLARYLREVLVPASVQGMMADAEGESLVRVSARYKRGLGDRGPTRGVVGRRDVCPRFASHSGEAGERDGHELAVR